MNPIVMVWTHPTLPQLTKGPLAFQPWLLEQQFSHLGYHSPFLLALHLMRKGFSNISIFISSM
jgi:hypothetical protein